MASTAERLHTSGMPDPGFRYATLAAATTRNFFTLFRDARRARFAP